MNVSKTQRPRLFERLKKGLEELGQEARGEITLRRGEEEVSGGVTRSVPSDKERNP